VFDYLLPGFDLPKEGDYVARFSSLRPGQKIPRILLRDNVTIKILFLGDSNNCRFTFAPSHRTMVGKMCWDCLGHPEYGHMDLSHFFKDKKIEVYYFAVSGMRIAANGSWSAEKVCCLNKLN
jgi:hypothetical protein